MRQLTAAILLLTVCSTSSFAETCEEKFARLEIDGNADKASVRLTITSEMPGGQVMKNYHYSNGDGDGMSEMIEPADMPWSLFIGNNMYSSSDKGASWSHMNSWDKEKQTADMKASMSADMTTATDIVCGQEVLESTEYEVVEGRYKSSALQGADLWSKFWVDRDTGKIIRKDSITSSAGGEYKTSQIIEPWPDLVLPKPE